MTTRTAGQRSGKSILVVEDDGEIRESLRQVLEAEGYSVCTAENGRDALDQLAHRDSPCLILLDLMMPLMSGSEFLAVASQDDRLSKIPIVLVTAWPREAQMAPKQCPCVQKPVDLDVLLRMVRTSCGDPTDVAGQPAR